ncbi:MAG TPA: TonB-dependent receptor [Pseudolabrys sp.]|nr:TonB-dependent receptor [Pseudolabrys sp.]
MRKYSKCGGAFAALVGLAAVVGLTQGAALAQEKTQYLPPIVVSPTTIPTPLDQVASSVTVITAEDLRRDQIRTVPDALRTVPGLNIVQSGGPGGQTAIFMRGTNSNHVKVLIDGIDAGDSSVTNGAVDIAHMLAGDIEQIEVLRGPQSGLYGSDAIGGVISITTKKGEGPPKVTATLEGGSFSTFNQKLGLSGSQNQFNYAFNATHFHAGKVPVTPLDLLGPGVARNDDNYDNWTYSSRLGANLSDSFAVNLIGRYVDAKHGLTTDDAVNFPPNSAPAVLQDTQRNHQLFTRGEAVWSLFEGKFENTFGVNYTNQWTWFNDPNADSFNPFGTVAPPTTNVGKRVKYDWRGNLKLMPGQTLVFGLEKEIESLRTDSTATGFGVQTTTTASRGNKAGYIELQSEFAKRLFIVANVRTDDNESFGPRTTWRVAPAFIVPGTETKLKATYGTGFKAPTLVELYVNNPSIFQVANPNLKPETSKGYDLGFEQPLLNGRVKLGVTYFKNDIENLIVNKFDGITFTSTYLNVGQAKMSGVESFAALVVNEQLKLRADYTATVTRDETTELGLLRRPGNKSSLTAIWTPNDRTTISATLLHVSSWVDVNRDTATFIPRLDAPAYTTVNLAGSYDLNQNVTVFARADNLFNEQYQVPYGFLRPGLGVYGGVRLRN